MTIQHSIHLHGLRPFQMTNEEYDAATELAIEALVDLGGTAEDHSDEVQSAVMLGAVTAWRGIQYPPPAPPRTFIGEFDRDTPVTHLDDAHPHGIPRPTADPDTWPLGPFNPPCTCAPPNGPGGFHDEDCPVALLENGVTPDVLEHVARILQPLVRSTLSATCVFRCAVVPWAMGPWRIIQMGLRVNGVPYDVYFQNSWGGDEPTDTLNVYVSPTSAAGEILEDRVNALLDECGVEAPRFDADAHEIAGWILEVLTVMTSNTLWTDPIVGDRSI